MSETIRISVAAEGGQDSVTALSADLQRLKSEELDPLAEEIATTFRDLGDIIRDELGAAAQSGRLSIRDLVDDILEDFARLAAEELVRSPLENILGRVTGTVAGGLTDPLGRSPRQAAGLLGRLIGEGTRNG